MKLLMLKFHEVFNLDITREILDPEVISRFESNVNTKSYLDEDYLIVGNYFKRARIEPAGDLSNVDYISNYYESSQEIKFKLFSKMMPKEVPSNYRIIRESLEGHPKIRVEAIIYNKDLTIEFVDLFEEIFKDEAIELKILIKCTHTDNKIEDELVSRIIDLPFRPVTMGIDDSSYDEFKTPEDHSKFIERLKDWFALKRSEKWL